MQTGPDGDERAELSRLLNVKVAEIDDFENEFATKVESAMAQHDRSLNMKRLSKCRESIKAIEDRIAESNSTARVAKLVERLDELRQEEAEILQMIEGMRTSTLNEIFDAEYEDDEKDPIVDIDTITGSPVDQAATVEAPTANYTVSTHHITDDHSNFDFATRVDEWLSVDPFKSAWSQHRDFFIGPSPAQQVSYHLPVFDVVSVCDGDYRIPRCLWDELFDYQREGVEWMLKLHKAGHGGVLGDEMGLGKTIQVVAFLAALHVSGHLSQAGLILVPSTLLRQWIRELNTWWPPLRVVLLHSSSTAFASTRALRQFVDSAAKRAHVLVTSYGTAGSDLRKHLLPFTWSFVILDEGHKIRNPDAQVTLMCKQLQSHHRFALSGTPIQNNLTELWSLFDFVYPGLIGTLPTFKIELALPINAGGYANSSMIQVQTSYKCACTLRDLIKPYLMRRLKKHVFSASSANSSALPEKREEIVFCRITPYQQDLYEAFIGSDEVEAIMERRRNVLAGVDVLRKICNHPDLIELYCSEQRFMHEEQEFDDEEEPGAVINVDLARRLHSHLFAGIGRPRQHEERSGKIAVLSKILDLWQQQGHRALIFCQTRQMLNILEGFLQLSKPQMKFLRMDGTTPIKHRLELVDDFNRSDSPYFLFLLTTRVGGLGINLTGANRVIIYDPDWNPSTDLQARERVYRLGQTRQVSILRLITAGTIEEKIYHRQIFKQYLTQRILEDPKQTRFFRAADLYDLFSLNLDESTETGDMFAGLEEEFAKKMGDHSGEAKDKESDPVLNDLLDMVGVHSTMPTTSITEQIRPELALIEKEAQKVAEAALKALKQQRQPVNEAPVKRARTEADHYNTFKPTWTGRFGEQGNFCSSSIQTTTTEGPTAQDILEAIKRRKQSSSTGLNEKPSLQLALSIVDYFNRIRGSIDSDQLAHAFRAQVPDSESAVLFRVLLKQVAVLNRSTRKWRLKEEFIQK